MSNRSRITKIARWLLWIFLGLATLVALFFAEENWRGATAWKSAVEAYEADGESLGEEMLIIPAIPDGQNFCANEIFKDITVPQENSSESLAAEKLSQFRMWRDRSRDDGTHHSELFFESLPTRRLSFENHQSLDLTFLHAFYLETEILTVSPDPADKRRDVLEALEREHGHVYKILAAAAKRPESMFVPAIDGYEFAVPQGPPSRGALYSVPVVLPEVLGYRAGLALQVGDLQRAQESIAIILKLRQAMGNMRNVYDTVLGGSILRRGMSPVWEVLNKRAFDSEQLLWLQQELAQIDLEKELLKNWRHEIAYRSRFGSVLKKEGAKNTFERLYGSPGFRELGRKIGWAPDGWIDQNMADYLKHVHEGVIKPLRSGGFTEFEMHPIELGDSDLGFVPEWWIEVFGFNMRWDTLQLGVAHAHTLARQVELACALERFFLQHAAYPEELQQLVPDWIEKIPNDWADRNPMRYRRTPDGRYAIYSLGADGIDDGGTPGPWSKKNKKHYMRLWEHGDWVWRYSLEN